MSTDLEIIEDNLELTNETDQNIKKDLEEVRSNIKTLISGGSTVLKHLEDNCKASDEADYFDSYTKLLKVMGDLNGKYMENIDERKKEGEGSAKKPTGGDHHVHNTLITTETTATDIISKITGKRD